MRSSQARKRRQPGPAAKAGLTSGGGVLPRPIQPGASAPGSRNAQATGLESLRVVCVAVVDEPFCVEMTIELVSGTVVLGRISMFSGVNVHEAWSGSPAQESVTNMGLAKEAHSPV